MTQDQRLAKLRTFRTCDIADLLQRLGIEDGGYLPELSMFSPGYKMDGVVAAGPAYTVEFLPKDLKGAQLNGSSKPKTHWMDAATEGCIVLVHQNDGANSAVMGGVISARAHAIGVAGIVVDGRVRDLEEHRQVGLPVWSRGTSVLCPATKNIVIGQPIKICGQPISPGDYIVADQDGVIHFAPELLDEVIKGVPVILETENNVRDAVLKGMPVHEAHSIYKPYLNQGQAPPPLAAAVESSAPVATPVAPATQTV